MNRSGRIPMLAAALAALLALLAASGCRTGRGAALRAFYAPPANPGTGLPADGIYPRGRRLAFMGYSGDPARDLKNGFTVAGPVYGNQAPYLETCFRNGWPVVAHVGVAATFNDKAPDKYKVDAAALRETVARQVKELAPHREIVWWAVRPEELRPWRADEMNYLATVCAAVRENDPEKRPVYLYNPNHRDAASLLPVAREVDVLGKGCYVNSCGKKRERAWVAWSIGQEVEAVRQAGRPGAIPLLMPELCKDPDPGEEKEIRGWVRHDVYLGLVSGAKGVLLWSLFKRKEVRGTWQAWYDAYAECGRELNGARALAQVFLFGERRNDLTVAPAGGAAETAVTLGGGAEPGTTSAAERAERKVAAASWTAAEFAYGSGRWLFLVNSANAPAAFTVSGWPAGSVAENAFDGSPAALEADGRRLSLTLPAYGVAAVRFGTGK